jgi:uncharacterized protein
MDPTTTHGAFSWNELMTSDPEAAAAFYGALFGWQFKSMGEEMGGYQVGSVGTDMVCGLMGPPPGAPPMPPAWGSYVTVDNVEATLERCRALGGKTLVPPMDVPGVGRMAVLQDPQGATLSIMKYSG